MSFKTFSTSVCNFLASVQYKLMNFHDASKMGVTGKKDCEELNMNFTFSIGYEIGVHGEIK